MKLSEHFPQDEQVTMGDGNVYIMTEMHVNASTAIEERFGFEFTPTNPDTGNLDLSGFLTFVNQTLRKPATWRFVVWQLLRRPESQRSLTEEDVGYLLTTAVQENVFRIAMKKMLDALPLTEQGKKDMTQLLDKATVKVSVGSES